MVENILAKSPSPSPSECTAISSQESFSSQHATDSNEEERELLQHVALDARKSNDHELRTVPVISRDAYIAAGAANTFPQRGVFGCIHEVFDGSGICAEEMPKDNRLYLNTNTPFSALVCGVQGSGKSHTVSIMLENMLIQGHPAIGCVQKPLAGLIIHFGEGGTYSQPCEAAWLGVARNTSLKLPAVKVYVSGSSFNTMKAVYAPLGPRITVEPLLFSETELDAQAFLSLMAIGNSDHVPLYMQTVLCILRELGETFTYRNFMLMLEEKKMKFNPAQRAGIEQRLALLESFMEKKGQRKRSSASARFAPGQLTIIDLSDHFIDPASACGFFEIIVRMFVRAPVGNSGKVLLVDEAHKYLSATRSTGLTQELLSLIRQQRHQRMRVIISTQEPTVVPPVLLDLCSIALFHRFSSPSWWEHVAKHVSADVDQKTAFDKVVNLQTGQAILLAPSGLGTRRALPVCAKDPERRADSNVLRQFGRKCLLIKARQRVTKDGGASMLVVEA